MLCDVVTGVLVTVKMGTHKLYTARVDDTECVISHTYRCSFEYRNVTVIDRHQYLFVKKNLLQVLWYSTR